MTFWGILYQLIISPITLLLEAVYSIVYHFLQSCGASIFPLSLVVNLLLLPFYTRADAIQAEEREKQKQMEPDIEHLKASFKGDKRYMIMQTYYRQHNYKPIYALRSSVALLLEIPFFIAAYSFLRNLPDLKRSSFLILENLGKPDALLPLFGFHINILPILMTLINVLSSSIYTRGQKFKDKLQLYGIVLIFLVLLYNSPSGLVLYWTLNNVFSLVKNIVNTSKDRKKSAAYAFSLLGALILLYSVFFKGEMVSKLLIVLVGLSFQLPFLLLSRKKSPQAQREEKKADTWLFFSGALVLSLLLGVFIPSGVIASSPSEFVLMTSVHSPVRYIFFAFLTAAGAFVLWGGLFYSLVKQKSRRIAGIAVWIFSIFGILNYLIFGKSDSILSSDLKFDTGLNIRLSSKLLNLLLVAGVVLFMLILLLKKERIVRSVSPVFLAGLIVLSGYNIYKISKAMPDIRRVIANTSTEIPSIPVSKNGQNVMVIMVDRSVSSYIPYMMNEKPELAEQFSGFTYYPNTLSFGMRTVVASPSLFGGYDYMPSELNKRPETTLRDKHDEALLTMPVLFANEGYDVTVIDPPFAGYSQIPDLSIYDPYPGIKAYTTVLGTFRDSDETDQALEDTWKRDFFCYSLMKVSPLFLQSAIYSDGTYFEPVITYMTMDNISDNPGHFIVSQAHMNYFCDAYAVLTHLPSMTTLETSSENTFLLLQNETAHNIMPLKEPEYEPAYEFDNTEYDETHKDRFTVDGQSITMDENYQLIHYQSNMAAFLQLGKWMDYLRELGVYDNTRIIIVSDHGWPMGQRESMILFDGDSVGTTYNSEDAMAYNPVLLYKDFGSDAPFTTDYTFMTNADTPYLAMNGIFDNPLNPFTSRPLFQPEAKNAEKMYIMYTDNWGLAGFDECVFKDTIWYSLANQNVFDKNNWKEEEEP